MPRDMGFQRETSRETLACTLVPGDWLYVPRGWWHMAHASQDSLSISTGLLTPAARGAVRPQSRRRRAWDTGPSR